MPTRKKQPVLKIFENGETPINMGSPSEETLSQVLAQVLEINRKLLEQFLNGELVTIPSRMDKVETTMVQISKSLQDMNQALYNPDDGLYSRLKTMMHSQKEENSNLNSFKDTVIRWGTRAFTVFVGALVTLLGKLVYDLIVGHLRII